MSAPPPRLPLEERVRRRMAELLPGGREGTLLVALSGGMDSVALLHLLRFGGAAPGAMLAAAHVDHGMRPGSEADARWVRGLCRAWGVPLRETRLPHPPRGEAEARRARHAFLRRAAEEAGAAWIVTAHHADDQAETVLFRVARGTGLRGLAGMAPRGPGPLLRPLLGVWCEELERYARAQGLRWRTDPSNRSLRPARNRIRHRVLPELERGVAPGARRSLVALAQLAREEEGGRARAEEALLREVATAEGEALLLARPRLRAYDSRLGMRLIRRILRRFGVVPGRVGTRTALQFITDAPSGRELQLPGGVRIRTELDRARVERAKPAPPEDRPETLPDPLPREPGTARLLLGGSEVEVRYRRGTAPEAGPGEARVPLADAVLPLSLRGWRPGDRVRTSGGTKPLKKLFLEERIASPERHRLPLLVDARGTVLWVAGIRRALIPSTSAGGEFLFLSFTNDR